MIICPKCFTDHADKDARCSKCGASILGITDAANKENIRTWRAKRRLRSHMLTGFILCFVLPTLIGLPSSLFPKEIFFNLITGALFGVPLGYFVSKYARTTLGGAAIGCGIGIVYCIVVMFISGSPVTMGAVLMGVGTGILPGAIMGMHVSMDS